MAAGLRRSPGSRRRNNLEPRSRESRRRPPDPHHRRHRLPRQGGADDAARPLSGRGQDLRPRASARRRDGRRPLLRQGRRNAAVPTAARTPRRRLRGLPAKEMRRSCRRRHRFDARPLRGAGQRAHRQAGVRDQLRGARHLQSLAGAGGAGEYRGGTQRRGAVQEDGRDARAHLHLLRRGNTSRPGVRGRAVDRQLSEGARSRRGGARPLRRRCRAEGRRRRRGAAARAGGRRHSRRAVSRRGRPAARGRRAGSRGSEGARTRLRSRAETLARAAARPGGNGESAGLGLAEHVHVHQGDGRAGHRGERLPIRAGAPRHRGERAPLSLPGLERRVHDLRAAGVHGAQRTAGLSRGTQAGARPDSGRPRRGRHPRRRGSGVRGAAAATRLPARVRRREPLLRPALRRAGGAVQAAEDGRTRGGGQAQRVRELDRHLPRAVSRIEGALLRIQRATLPCSGEGTAQADCRTRSVVGRAPDHCAAGARQAVGPRVALRFYAGEDSASELARTRDDHITYDELARFSDRAGRALQSAGIKAGDRVLLMSENRPEWAMGYFGILKAGAAAAPLDQGLSAQEVQNCAAAAKAPLLLASPKVVERLRAVPGLRTLTLPAGLRRSDEAGLPPLRRSAAADDVASVLFTSGTTGKPKGVVLTHRNFASLAAKIAGLFDLRVGEGVLSVLPLHHTFEFSCGLLVPLMLGAEITYLDELTADRLSDALNTGRIHALIGVPALWQLLHRRLTQELASRPRAVEAAIQAAMALHGELRNRTPFNVGKLLFWPIHNRFGGKLRLLVSGGSALPEEVQKAFDELGFDLTEGYGLTEAAPVLSVTMPENRLRTGTVGPPLPGVEIRIENPDADGVGEVLAKGPNVMAGYLDDPEATREVLAGGWLRTGDLGRLDEDGHLTLVGRKKDLILDASGKNVYPDELEEIYGASPRIKELSIVGLPDGKGHERVACLCVPAAREDRAKVEEHFARISAELPFWKRVKVLHFWDGDLPKTATRKVKRPLVVAELLRLEKATAAATQLATEPAGSDAWLYDLLADLAQKPRGSVNAQTRLVADLGFDSLLVAELTVALEKAGVKPPPESESATITTAGELARRIEMRGDNGAHARDGTLAQKKDDDIFIPGPVAAACRAAISFFQKALYGGVFEIDVSGQANVPANGAV